MFLFKIYIVTVLKTLSLCLPPLFKTPAALPLCEYFHDKWANRNVPFLKFGARAGYGALTGIFEELDPGALAPVQSFS